jgi:hypothetical protein
VLIESEVSSKNTKSETGHDMHAPPTQEPPAEHAWLQLPQCVLLVVVSAHTPQSVSGTGHVQLPPLQILPPVHVTPHEPQLFGSEFVSTHTPPHGGLFPAQTHAPPMHVWFAPQAWLHEPQCETSVDVSTHTPLHEVLSHVQCPPMQS